MRSEAAVIRALDTYADTVRRICLCSLKDPEQTKDIFQDVFLKYMLYTGEFQDAEHEKAWLIRVTVNACKDHLRQRLRHPTLSLEEQTLAVEPENREVLAAVLSLPQKYRNVIYLHYYEGYSALEIAGILRTKENTVYSLLSRGREMLKKQLGGEEDGR